MAERSSSNVVSLRSQEPASDGTPVLDSAPLLAGCRDRLANGLSTLFAQHLGDANENLLGMADRATSMEQQQLYFMALELLNKSNQRLLQGFRDTYVKAFDQAIGRLRGERSDSGSTLRLPTELSLVDTEDFERDLAIGKLSARATFNCSQQLTALDRRLAALLRLSRIGQDDNPLYPRTLFTAMLDTLDAMGAGEQLGLVLVHEFERQTAAELPGIYAEINRYLIDAGVLPKIPLAGSQHAPRAQSLDEGAGSHGQGGAGAGARQGMEGDGTRSHEDVFAQLAQALQAGMAHQSRGAFPTLAPSLPMSPGWNMTAAGPGAVGLIQALDQVQRGQIHPGPLSGLGQAQLDPRGLDVLRQIRATPIVNSSHPVDAMTIDIVSMLFGAIFNDPDLSPSMRAELARLQIPVLKVALLDKAFFSDRRHPARRLLDLIASSGIGRSEMDEPRLIDKIRAIVDAIVDGFDADIGVFAAQTQKLEEFLKDEEARAQSKAARVLGDIAQRDRQVVAGGHVESELKSRLAHPELPSLIADFLDQHWRRVLVERFVRVGEDSDPWREALGVMDDLIWSVQPKDNAEERERLLARLPELIPRLRAGLAQLDPAQDQEPFFSALLRLHMAVLNRAAPPAEASPAPTSEPATPLTEPGTEAPEASAAPAAATTATPSATRESEPPEAPEEDDDRYSRLAQALDVGAWIEFQSFRGTRKTLRLSWVSQYRGVYLFTNRQGDNALTLAATSLASHLRNGTARLLSQDPLTERAVSQVLEQVGGDLGKTT